MKKILSSLLVPMLLFGPTSEAMAATTTAGQVSSLQHYAGHSGILIKLDVAMVDPDACGRSDWYIMPDDSPHASFVQSLLLTAQSTNRKVNFMLEGCLQGIPKVAAVWN